MWGESRRHEYVWGNLFCRTYAVIGIFHLIISDCSPTIQKRTAPGYLDSEHHGSGMILFPANESLFVQVVCMQRIAQLSVLC